MPQGYVYALFSNCLGQGGSWAWPLQIWECPSPALASTHYSNGQEDKAYHEL
jgi:hypothetical protein